MPDTMQSSVFLRKSAWVTTVELMELKFLKRNNKPHHWQPPVSSCVTTLRLSECVAVVPLNSQQFGKISKHSFSSSPPQSRPSWAAAGLLSHLGPEEFSRDFISTRRRRQEREERPDWRIWNSQWRRRPTLNILMLKGDRDKSGNSSVNI